MESMYEQLLNLPLLKGVSINKLTEMVGKTRLHFMKYMPDRVITKAGEPCNHITFVISGSVRVVVENANKRFAVSQTLKSPDVYAPEFLFGKAPYFPCTVTAIEPTGILKVSKTDYLNLLKDDSVFLLNFLNILSRNAQKGVEGILSLTQGSLEERLAYWIIALTQPSGFDIRLTARHRDLYTMFGVPRSSLVAALDNLKRGGVLDYVPGEITVLSRPLLLDVLHPRLV